MRPEFVGNQRLSSEFLVCALGNALSDRPAPAGGSKQDSLADAEALLNAVYYDQGYLQAQVTMRRGSGSARFEIHEGERFRLGTTSVNEVDDGGRAVAALGGDENLRRMLHVQRGQWFARSAVLADLRAIGRMYRDAGYAMVEVLPKTDVQLSPPVTNLAIEVRRGPLVTVERVEVKGNQRATREALLGGFHPAAGELFNETSLDASRQRISASGLVRRVDVSTEAVPGRSDRVVINVEVLE